MLLNGKKILLFIFITFFAACGGSGGGSQTPTDSGIDPTPDFSPSSSEELAALVVNTFQSAGISISVTPDTIDFNAAGAIDKGEQESIAFTLTNNSGATKSFSFQFYAVSSGFSLADENDINLGAWDAISLADGESKEFNAVFDANLFGTHTTYLTITAADTEGYIHLPMRASVTGASDFRIISTGYMCSDTDAPSVTFIDFTKVATGASETRELKICNTGGEDIEIESVEMSADDSGLISAAFDGDAYQDFVWGVEDEINDAFVSGVEPDFTRTFAEPTFVPYSGEFAATQSDFSAVIDTTGTAISNTLVKAGELLRFNVSFSPSLDAEAPEGQLYEPVASSANMRIKTTVGTVEIPLVAATGGREPVLKMSYRLSDSEAWREIDMTSSGAAVYFGQVDVFRDWVTDNYRDVEIKIENAGTGSKSLEFYPASLAGYFEYQASDGGSLSFPIVIASGGEASSFKIRYLPTPSEAPEAAAWDFGQFYFQHTGGNGPKGKLALVGEQNDGYAVELKFGGSTLERAYGDTSSKNLCVVQIEDGTSVATKQTYTVLNNDKNYPLTVSWSLTQDGDSDAAFTATPASGSLTVEPSSSGTFSADLYAQSGTADGATIRGTLSVTTNYPSEQESEYAAQIAALEARDFTVPFTAQASSTGVCALGGGQVIGKDATAPLQATIIFDRLTMILTSLIESTRNHPAFKFHLPIEIDAQNGRARISQSIPFITDKDDPQFSPIHQFRSYAHQITNIQGCAPLPSNPYRLEYVKGSWTGEGFQCNDTGEISYTGRDGAETVLNTDTACLPNNGAEETTVDGVRWVVFYHDFVKFDASGCDMEYYGKIASFAYRPDQETFKDVFALSEANPNGSEADFEQIYNTFKFDSYIYFNKTFSCGSKTYAAGEVETDPDALKTCFTALAERDDTTRNEGFVNECSYFNFIVDEGTTPSDALSETPDTDSWSGYGLYEPHVDADGNIYDTKYDLTLYNVHAQVFALSPGDRVSFFRHPGHLLYSELYVTFTTKPAVDPNDQSNWQDLIAVDARPNFDKNQVFLSDGDPYDVDQFWRDGMNDQFSTALDDSAMESGVDYGGFGKGNFLNCPEGTGCDIVPSGWPINFDENNLMMWVGLGSFNGKGNTAPGFAKEDSSGKGKALYFTLHGCLVEGTPDETQGCYAYHLDDAVMDHDSSGDNDDQSVVDVYKDYGILPEGYPGDDADSSAADCVNFAANPLNDEDAAEYDPYQQMACINYKMFPIDRDRLINYYDATKFVYKKDYYGGSTCGYGM